MSDSLGPPWTIYSPPGPVSGVSQARILESVAIPFSRESSQPREPPLSGRFFTTEPSTIFQFLKKNILSMYTKRDIITHIKEYYSAIKNEIMPFVATWIDLESIMPSEIKTKTI